MADDVQNECRVRTLREEIPVATRIVERESPVLRVGDAAPAALDVPDGEWLVLGNEFAVVNQEQTDDTLGHLAGDQLLVDANGKSHISVEDFAVAMIDELDHPAHLGQRFTVGY